MRIKAIYKQTIAIAFRQRGYSQEANQRQPIREIIVMLSFPITKNQIVQFKHSKERPLKQCSALTSPLLKLLL
ncbi:hypothetical protein BCT84_19165 [Vibrio breoganii]|nr:hypothetical protein BCT84_19165 [Vibrio breoganii]